MLIKFQTKFNISDLVKYHQNGYCTPIVYRIASIRYYVGSSGSRIVYDVFDSASLTPHLEYYDEDELMLFQPPVVVQELPF